MSHSSGITVSPQLLDIFSTASREGNGPRIIQVKIINETTLEVVKQVEPVHDWEKDFDLVPTILDEREACFVLLRTDESNSQGNALWYILSYVPDKCKVRDKMVYAASQANLKTGIGANNVVDEIHGTTKSDFTSSGFAAWRKHQEAEVPLTDLEIQKNEELEAGLFKGGAGTSSAYVHGVAFPVNDDVLPALDSFVNGEVNYLQIGIDPNNERITLEQSATIDISEVPSKCPTNEPRFHFFRWLHDFEEEQFDSIIYCYSCPSSPVKLRMLYSTSKAHVAGLVEGKGLTIHCKLEITNGPEFSVEDVSNIIHPPKAEQKKTFAKPKPKGGRVLIRNKE